MSTVTKIYVDVVGGKKDWFVRVKRTNQPHSFITKGAVLIKNASLVIKCGVSGIPYNTGDRMRFTTRRELRDAIREYNRIYAGSYVVIGGLH